MASSPVIIQVATPGPAGPQGPIGPTGTPGYTPHFYVAAGPPASGTGLTGDMYINSVNSDVWGPKINDTTWPATASMNIEGATGATGYSPQYIVAPGAPAAGVGANGDMYINATTSDVWGPKSGGLWPASPACNIKGATGPQGPAGLNLTDPTTAKGDFIIRQSPTILTRLGVGADGMVLTADAAQVLGVKWATPAAGGGSQTPWTQNIEGGGFTLNNAGKIAIGVSVPAARFHVAGIAANPAISLTDPEIALIQADTNVQLSIGAAPGSPNGIWLQTKHASVANQTFPLVLNPLGGNVGIGIAAPAATLHVGRDDYRQLYLTSGTTPTAIQLRLGGDASNNTGVVEAIGSGAATTLLLNPSGGVVGIGNVAPQGTALSINPKANASSVATAKIFTIGESTNTSGYYMGFGMFHDGVNWNGSIQTLQGGGGALLILNGIGGNVGVAKLSPQYQLDIGGDCNISGTYRVNGTPISTGGGPSTFTSGGKAIGTVYQNQTSKPIWVNVVVSFSAVNSQPAQCDTANPPTTQVAIVTASSGVHTLSFIVLPNYFYRILSAANVTLTAWYEWT